MTGTLNLIRRLLRTWRGLSCDCEPTGRGKKSFAPTPKEVLQTKLHKALLEAKARLEFQRESDSDE
jgi:hypothetical protein